MKIESQHQDDCTLSLTVEVDDERVQPALRAAARRLAKQYKFPGFRPGKAPYETVVRQVGENAVYGEALEELGQKIYLEALEHEKIDAFAPGALEHVDFKPMVLKFSVPLRPAIELGDYRANLRVDYALPEVSDGSVQESMEHLREHKAELSPVERPAQLGDVATLDAKGFLNEGENPSDFLLADKAVALLLDEKAEWPVPGFAPEIVGLSAGSEKRFDLTFPETYANQSMRGQVAHFEVQVNEVKQRSLPEWTDELAKSFGEYDSLDDLRTKLRSDLEQQASLTTARAYADQVVGKLVEAAQVKFPPILLEEELDEYLDDLDRRLREQRLTLDDYLKIEAKTKDAFREQIKPEAEQRLRRTLVLGKLVDAEQLSLTPEEVEAHIDTMSATWGERAGEMRKALETERARRMLSLDLLTNKAIARLAAIARGQEVPALEPAAAPETESAPAEAGPPAPAPSGELETTKETEAAPAQAAN